SVAKTDGASVSAAGSGSASMVQVAGAAGIAVTHSTAKAFIPDGRTIRAGTVTADGVLTLRAENNTDSSASADGSAANSQPARTFDGSDAHKLDLANDTIDLGAGHGLETGDRVRYHHGEGTDIKSTADKLKNGDVY